MKKYLWVIFVFLFIFSCSRNETDPDIDSRDCKIISAKQYNYLLDDVEISNIYNPNFSKFGFEYDSQNRISKVIGSLVASPPNSGFYLSNDSFDEITYSGNTILVKVSANIMIRPYDKEFTIENGKILSQKITSKYPVYTNTISTDFTYEYSGNQIFERFNGILNNRLFRTFTIENGNLKKVIKWKYDSDGNINGKTEIIFSNYDTQDNLLKDKFFINGAFYMAFSKNIFNSVDSKSYNLENGIFIPNGNYFSAVYTPDMTSDYFEKQCN